MIVKALAHEYQIPLALHLDHHENPEDIFHKINRGIRSVMIDGSHFPFEENIALVKTSLNTATVTTPALKLSWAVWGQEDDLIVEGKTLSTPRQWLRWNLLLAPVLIHWP